MPEKIIEFPKNPRLNFPRMQCPCGRDMQWREDVPVCPKHGFILNPIGMHVRTLESAPGVIC